MNGMATGPVVIAAGGTGGHVFPALALARGLINDGQATVFVTDRRGGSFGAEFAEVPCHTVRAGALAGRGVLGTARGIADMILGIFQARKLLRRLAPSLAVGFGGYPAVPPLLAAWSLGVPTLVHEANAVLGRANRLLAPRACAIATAFPETAKLRATDRARAAQVGIPVREAFLSLRDRKYEKPTNDNPINVLVVGGSQGARVLGTTLPKALVQLPDALRRRLRLVQQCRAEDLDAARETYRQAGIDAHLAPFIDDVAERLGAAHLVIARAGASTIAELATVGRPAILIPYPHATDNHQEANARSLAGAGGAWVMVERDMTVETLGRLITDCLGDASGLEKAATASRDFGRPDAVDRLVAVARDLMRHHVAREDAA
jgi:UDP-N-acetylglucosamine--N-acetylmuramyl-(pentapeptide) pyrophosphoryl-undecaprenol N-acetylglucosamine transferase